MNSPTNHGQSAPVEPVVPQQSGSVTLVVIALIMGLVTVLMTNWYISVVKKDVQGRSFTVYRLKRDVDHGYVLREKDLTSQRIPDQFKESLSNAITPDALKNWVGQKVQRSAQEGELLTFDLFTQVGELLDQKIADGKRGCPLPLSSRTAPGILRPGMFIDILATIRQPGQLPRSMVVMERVKVVAVGSLTNESAAGRRTSYSGITVEVEPADASALLSISKYIGRDGFDILVRNPRERSTKYIGINPAILKLVGIKR